jgi:uncharacterized protein (DUF302 family)
MDYYHKERIDGEFEAVVESATEALQEEGFGVLCEIDVTEKFETKLGLDDYPQYRILGACNPALAKEGLDAEPDLGVLLPCNIVVYETNDSEENSSIVVSVVDPGTMLSVVDNPELDSIAEDVRERFDRVLDALTASE